MKKTLYKLLLTGILVAFTHTFYGQLYFSNNCRWNEYSVDIRNNSVVSRTQYFFKGDTLINNQLYHKLYRFLHNQGEYIGGLREENGKVYARLVSYENIGFIDEALIYDFTVKEGDIILSNCPSGALSRPLEVLKIDVIELQNGEKRKRFILTSDTWVEGIGSCNGLLYSTEEHMTDYTTQKMVCFKNNDEILYQDKEVCDYSAYNCCEDFPMMLKDKTTNNISLSPQLIKDFATLTIVNNKGNEILYMYDNKGNIVMKKAINDSIFDLDFSPFSQGIYYIIVQDKNFVLYSCKVVKE